MQQTPAAILVLAASGCGYASSMRAHDSFGVMLGIAAIGLGIWGGMSLAAATMTQWATEDTLREMKRMGHLEAGSGAKAVDLESGTINFRSAVAARDAVEDVRLSPEVRAQLSVVSRVRGQNRTEIIDEVLRQNLPRYGKSRSA